MTANIIALTTKLEHLRAANDDELEYEDLLIDPQALLNLVGELITDYTGFLDHLTEDPSLEECARAETVFEIIDRLYTLLPDAA